MASAIWVGFVASTLVVLCMPYASASANHEAIGLVPDNKSFYIEGEPITAPLLISTGNTVFDHERVSRNNETFYFASFQYSSFETGRVLPAYNVTLSVPLMDKITHTYERELPAGLWILDIEVRDGGPTGRLLYSETKDVLVKGLEVVIIQRQAEALEASARSSDLAIIAGIGGAALSGFGGAFLGAHLSRKAAREQWTETKGEMEKDRKVSEDSLNVSKETMRQQLRPWIGRSDIILEGAYMESGEYVTLKREPRMLEQPMPIQKLVFKFWMENYGKLPALHTSMGYTIATSDDPNATLDKADLAKVTYYQNITVMPSEKIPMNIEIPAEKLEKAKLMVLGRVKYSYAGGTGFYDFIMEFDGLNWTPKYNEAG